MMSTPEAKEMYLIKASPYITGPDSLPAAPPPRAGGFLPTAPTRPASSHPSMNSLYLTEICSAALTIKYESRPVNNAGLGQRAI